MCRSVVNCWTCTKYVQRRLETYRHAETCVEGQEVYTVDWISDGNCPLGYTLTRSWCRAKQCDTWTPITRRLQRRWDIDTGISSLVTQAVEGHRCAAQARDAKSGHRLYDTRFPFLAKTGCWTLLVISLQKVLQKWVQKWGQKSRFFYWLFLLRDFRISSQGNFDILRISY